MTRCVVLDTETTGLSPDSGDRIIEIGCVELFSRKPTGRNKHLYVNPEREIHEDAMQVHGISREFLADKPKFAEIADELLDYLAGAEVIIHNAPFDVAFLDKELELLGRAPFATCVTRVVDSLALAKEYYPGKRNSLDALCERLGVDNASRTLHGALLDARLLAEVYINLTRGQEALLIDLEDAASTDQAHRIDLRQFTLPVLEASDAELRAHEAVLDGIDKASAGRTIWRLHRGSVTQ